MSPASHAISVGYGSIQEMADWLVVRNASNDCAAYSEASAKVSEYLGSTIAADIKTWRSPLKDVVTP